ncbi:DUF1731 domain-containing protein [Geitlerinema splendidum]|nr:DUF1731 domain-containing protein [Geitlerinema splendidum]
MNALIPPSVWINAGGVGIYGDRGDEALSESSRPGGGFLADVSSAWEAACLNSESKTRTVVARFGVVLGREGGAFPIFLKLAKLFIGGPAGNGRQWMSWIHIEDLCRLLEWMIEEDHVSGAVNAVSPDPVRNGDFMDELRKAVGRPPVPGMPNAIFRQLVTLTGKEPSVLLESQRVFPVLAMSKGFEFQFPEFHAAIEALIEQR